MATTNPQSFGVPRPATPNQVPDHLQRSTMLQAQASGTPTSVMPTHAHEITPIALCRIGQDTVHEVLTKSNDLFLTMKLINLPNNENGTYQEKKMKCDELVKTLAILFKKLRTISDRVKDATDNLEPCSAEELLPFVGVEGKEVKIQSAEAVMYASEEQKEVAEQLKLKNKQLKEVIDQLRTAIWEVNTMMAMQSAT